MLAGEVVGPINNNHVDKVGGLSIGDYSSAPDGHVLTKEGGALVAKEPATPTAAQVSFEPGSTGLPDNVQAALLAVNDKTESGAGGSDAESIQGTEVTPATPLPGQSLVVNASSPGVYVPRFTSPSSDRLITTPGTVFAALGENLYVDVASGDVDIRLPAGPAIGSTVRVKRLSTNASLVTIDGNGATIDGDTAISIKPHEAALFRCYAPGRWARLGKCEAIASGSVRHLGLEYDPIALWKLDGNLLDSSGNGYHLTVQGSNPWATPTQGFRCLSRVGTDVSSGNLPPSHPLCTLADLTLQTIALVSVVQQNNSDSRLAQVSAGGATGQLGPSLYLTNSAFGFRYRNAANTGIQDAIATRPPLGEWALFAATRRYIDGLATVRLYANGALLSETTGLAAAFVPTSTGRVQIGQWIQGLIGSVKINDRALTDAEIYAEAQRAGRAP